MALQIWVGLTEVRQLPGTGHAIILSAKGAFTWVSCWACDASSFERRVSEVFASYGLFIMSTDLVMTYARAQGARLFTDELAAQVEETSRNENFCIYGTFHTYAKDN